jgi:enamine deaminase RidA (YjgF/YER057c/UK114 family)
MSIHERLSALNIELPRLPPPVAAFIPVARTGDLVFVSGHIARRGGRPWVGRLGEDMTTEEGAAAARAVAIDLLAALHGFVGDLGAVKRIVKLLVLVNSAASFTEQHLVANGASELLVQVFGDAGAHARAAFGVAQLPFGSCVEIEMIAEVSRAGEPG